MTASRSVGCYNKAAETMLTFEHVWCVPCRLIKHSSGLRRHPATFPSPDTGFRNLIYSLFSRPSGTPSVLSHFSRVQLLVTPWTVAHQTPRSMDSPGKSTGVGCHAPLQGIFLTQGSNPCLVCLLHCRQILYHCTTWEAWFSVTIFICPRSTHSWGDLTLKPSM